MKDNTYKKIWKEFIKKKAKKMVDKNQKIVEFDKSSKERIREQYDKLRFYCKERYMINADASLDRHKVCACLALAIVKAKPFSVKNNEDGKALLFNETLAFDVALEVMKCFICVAHSNDSEYEETLKNGFSMPETELDLSYVDQLKLMLFYDVRDNHYSILALANILFLIEDRTLQKNLERN